MTNILDNRNPNACAIGENTEFCAAFIYEICERIHNNIRGMVMSSA